MTALKGSFLIIYNAEISYSFGSIDISLSKNDKKAIGKREVSLHSLIKKHK